MKILISIILLILLNTGLHATDWLGKGAPEPVVKLYGEGGIAGVEAYQTGLLVSLNDTFSSEGWILTVDSPALGSGDVLSVLHNGERLIADFVASDPTTEMALLKVELEGDVVACYCLGDFIRLPKIGQTLYAVSNTFNIATGEEAMTVQRTLFSSLAEVTTSRLGGKELRRQVLLMDSVTSNPGTAGGAVVDREGNLVGMIGKESRSSVTGNWINYAILPEVLFEATNRMISNPSIHSRIEEEAKLRLPGSLLNQFGASFVPTLADRAPPLIEHVAQNSFADQLGLAADDLVISINSQSVSSARQAEAILSSTLQKQQLVQVTVIREGLLVELAIERRDQE